MKRENKQKPKVCWDKEVEQTIKERQEASKAHIKIKNDDRPKEEVDRKWMT